MLRWIILLPLVGLASIGIGIGCSALKGSSPSTQPTTAPTGQQWVDHTGAAALSIGGNLAAGNYVAAAMQAVDYGSWAVAGIASLMTISRGKRITSLLAAIEPRAAQRTDATTPTS